MADDTLIHVGALVRVEATFLSNGVPVDPTTVTGKYMTPGGIETAYVYGINPELVKDTTGVYHFDVDIDASGTWTVRMEGSGAYQGAWEESFVVQETVFA